VIFVSIDDNEVFHLGLLMEQVFGAANFIANVIWQKVFSPKSTAQHFSDDHEYIVCFALNKTVWRPNPVPRSVAQDKAYKNPDKDPRGPWTSRRSSARNFYSKGTYPITCPSGRVVAGPPPGNYWRFSKKSSWNWIADNRIWWGKDGDNMPTLKRFPSDVQKGVVPQTLWKYERGRAHAGCQAGNSATFFDSKIPGCFSTPKPVA
jgi:adenine-specific DNA-methyltransferase